MAQEQNAQQTGSFLENVAGASQEQVAQATSQGQGAADVLFGTQGVIPGQSLNARGAAQASLAASLPGFAGLRGQEALTRSELEHNQALRELQQKRPEIMREVMNDLIQQELAKYGARINAGYLQNAQTQTALDALGLENDAANDRRDKKGKRRERREKIFDNHTDKAWDMVESLSGGKENPKYKSDILTPNQPKMIPYTPEEVYRRLNRSIGRSLRQRGFSASKVRSMIRQAMGAYDFDLGTIGLPQGPGTGSPTKGGQGPQE